MHVYEVHELGLAYIGLMLPPLWWKRDKSVYD